MRLLHARTEELCEFLGSDVPNYAILSHTWGDDEVLFNDIQGHKASLRTAYSKVSRCCLKAIEDGLEWVWIDTCCIDKSSSAELSEAINSMYQWYAASIVCYVYLEDVETGRDLGHNVLSERVSVDRSRWFTRGWTLQELIAPKYLKFYTSDWVDIGTKSSLVSHISVITGIPVRILRGEHPSSCNVAQRMSWAAGRNTSRLEDQAYCLLGLFGVNMPLLYGEGSRSFTRLQEQIMRQEEDYSIFAWVSRVQPPHGMRGVLASSPAEFTNSSLLDTAPQGAYNAYTSIFDDFIQNQENNTAVPSPYQKLRINKYHEVINHDFNSSPAHCVPQHPPELTSRGLRVSLPVKKSIQANIDLAWIHCEHEGHLVCLPLQRSSARTYSLAYRWSPVWLVKVEKSLLPDFELTQVFLHPFEDCSKELGPELLWPAPGSVRVCLGSPGLRKADFWPPILVEGGVFPFNIGAGSEIIGVLDCEGMINTNKIRFRICFGVVNDSPWCTIAEKGDEKSSKDSVRSTYVHHTEYSQEHFYRFADRVVIMSSQALTTVLIASIRRDAKAPKRENAYLLHVAASKSSQLLNWTNLHQPSVLSEENANARLPSVSARILGVLAERSISDSIGWRNRQTNLYNDH